MKRKTFEYRRVPIINVCLGAIYRSLRNIALILMICMARLRLNMISTAKARIERELRIQGTTKDGPGALAVALIALKYVLEAPWLVLSGIKGYLVKFWMRGEMGISALGDLSIIKCLLLVTLIVLCFPSLTLAFVFLCCCSPCLIGIAVLVPRSRSDSDNTEEPTHQTDKCAFLPETCVDVEPQYYPDIKCFFLDNAGDRHLFQKVVTELMGRLDQEMKPTKLMLSALNASQAKQEEAPGDARTPIIVPCLAVSRVASCIESVMNAVNIPASHRRLVVVFHPRAAHDQRVPSSRGQLGSQMRPDIDRIADIVFNRTNGQMYDSDENRHSVAEIATYIM